MAALQAIASAPAVPLVAATLKTVLQLLAAANQRVTILGWRVTFDGATSSAVPVAVDLQRQTSAGTAGSAPAARKMDDSISETILTTVGINYTAEPAAGESLDPLYVPAYGGIYEKWYPDDARPVIGGGDRVGIACTAPAGVNVTAAIWFEE